MAQRKHFTVTLGRLVREQLTITVEADSREDLEAKLNEVYEKAGDAHDGEWDTDYEWGADEGTHTVDEEVPVVEDGKILKL
jgi:hypothetical protein